MFFETTILDSKSELWYINKFIQIPLTYSQATKCFSKKFICLWNGIQYKNSP